MSDDNPTTSAVASQSQRAIRSPYYRDAYANGFRFRLSPIDFAIVFSSNTDMGGVVLQDEVGVNMSFQAVKILILHLEKAIKAIENEHGIIRVPRGSLPSEEQMHALMRSLRENPLTDG
jgi:hypothetical protein